MRNIKSNSYLVHYRPYQGTKKGKQVASSTKWGLGDNVLLLMQCLTPTVSFDLFMDNYFTSFRLFVCLPSLELIIFEQEVCSTKIGYANTLSSGRNSCKKNKKRGHLEQRSARQAKTLCNLYGWLEWHQGALHRFFWILPTYQKFVRLWNKVERKYINE